LRYWKAIFQQQISTIGKMPTESVYTLVQRITTKLGISFVLLVILFFGSSCRGRKSKGQKSISQSTYQLKGIQPGTFYEPAQSNKERNKRIEKVIAKARSLIGTPHKDGGVSSLGIDCSGLTLVSMQAIGMEIPRRAADQSQIGMPTTLEKLAPGDLVFFSDPKIGKGITHVGIVTSEGEGNVPVFIHTSSSLGVVETKLSEKYWQKTFHSAITPAY